MEMKVLKPALLMAIVQIAYASVIAMYKLAVNDGMSISVVTAYRLMFATAFTLPLVLIFERTNRPKLTWRVLFMSFLCGLFGASLYQNLYLNALALVSATFASAVYNLVPAVTFVLATVCGFEKLNMRTAPGKAKLFGTVIGIAGSMTLIFLKGAHINIWTLHINLWHRNGHVATLHAASRSKLLGVLCGIGSCFSYALWLIIQAKLSKEYPSHHSSSLLMSFTGAIQSTIFALCTEKDWSQWKLGWSIRLLTAVYSGIVANGGIVIVTAWCVRMRGPTYVSAFNPLALVVVALACSLMFDENLYLGSVIGAVLIVCGLYMVLWGKSKEMNLLVPSEITQELEATEVVVMSTTIDHVGSEGSNNIHTNSKSNIVTKVHI